MKFCRGCLVFLIPTTLLVVINLSFVSCQGPKLVSFPTLVSMLKARNNNTAANPFSSLPPAPASRPVLSSPTAQQLLEQLQQLPVSAPAEISPPLVSKHENLCYPMSRERKSEITRLCAGNNVATHRLSSEGSSAMSGGSAKEDNKQLSKCMETYCVTIIAEEEMHESDSIEQELETTGQEIVTYTDCEAIPPLYRVLRKSGAFAPKCYDCSS